jgi:hypothetical protein
MSGPLSAAQILEREYLAMRAKVLELAASFDRIQRADGSAASDTRWTKLSQGVQILLESDDCRAERVQLHFSREYSESWRKSFGIGGTPR